MSYTSCFPRGGLPACGGHGCQEYPAPVLTFPQQHTAVLSDALGDVLTHGQDVTLVHGTYYQFNGANFVHLGEQDYLSFTPHPRFPLSGLFQFRFHKYPIQGVDVNDDGSVPYQSPGLTIREGDFLMLECVGVNKMLTQIGAPNVFNMPFCSVPMRAATADFTSYGSQSPENIRIISDDFDVSLPAAQQPPVRLDGSKAYYIQFTRTGQNLALYPGQTPAPCLIKTSEYKGDGTRWLILPVTWHYGLAEGQAAPQTVSFAPRLRPEQQDGGFVVPRSEQGTLGGLLAQRRAGFGGPGAFEVPFSNVGTGTGNGNGNGTGGNGAAAAGAAGNVGNASTGGTGSTGGNGGGAAAANTAAAAASSQSS